MHTKCSEEASKAPYVEELAKKRGVMCYRDSSTQKISTTDSHALYFPKNDDTDHQRKMSINKMKKEAIKSYTQLKKGMTL